MIVFFFSRLNRINILLGEGGRRTDLRHRGWKLTCCKSADVFPRLACACERFLRICMVSYRRISVTTLKVGSKLGEGDDDDDDDDDHDHDHDHDHDNDDDDDDDDHDHDHNHDNDDDDDDDDDHDHDHDHDNDDDDDDDDDHDHDHDNDDDDLVSCYNPR